MLTGSTRIMCSTVCSVRLILVDAAASQPSALLALSRPTTHLEGSPSHQCLLVVHICRTTHPAQYSCPDGSEKERASSSPRRWVHAFPASLAMHTRSQASEAGPGRAPTPGSHVLTRKLQSSPSMHALAPWRLPWTHSTFSMEIIAPSSATSSKATQAAVSTSYCRVEGRPIGLKLTSSTTGPVKRRTGSARSPNRSRLSQQTDLLRPCLAGRTCGKGHIANSCLYVLPVRPTLALRLTPSTSRISHSCEDQVGRDPLCRFSTSYPERAIRGGAPARVQLSISADTSSSTTAALHHRVIHLVSSAFLHQREMGPR